MNEQRCECEVTDLDEGNPDCPVHGHLGGTFFADKENPVFDGPQPAGPLPGLNMENAGE